MFQALVRESIGNNDMKFRDVLETFVAGVPVMLNRISFSGELGYEIYCHPSYLLRLVDAIEDIGAKFGYVWYGARAMMSMRLEKGWGAWGLEYRPDFNVFEAGLDIFVNWKKEFIGKEASLKVKQDVLKQKLVTMTIDVEGIDVSNDEAILDDGGAVGYVSSGGYGHRTKKSLAMGYIRSDLARPGKCLQVEILGKSYNAEVLGGPLYDANGANMRS